MRRNYWELSVRRVLRSRKSQEIIPYLISSPPILFLHLARGFPEWGEENFNLRNGTGGGIRMLSTSPESDHGKSPFGAWRPPNVSRLKGARLRRHQ